MRISANRRQAGITLVELMVTMVILGIATTAIVMVWISLQNSFAYSSKSSEQREFTRDAITLVARELRDVRRPTQNSSISAINRANAYDISFYTSFHGTDTASPSPSVQYVQYEIQADGDHHTLFRQIDGGGWQRVLSYVMNRKRNQPLFTYSYINDSARLESGSAVLGDMTDRIVNIQIRLVVDTNPDHAPAPMTLTTTVQPRNLRST